ncbi:MAG: DMT family transporter [Lentimicrobiaceae bacterium]|jgi:drug/metabolite transporter (DMT)-like permease
MYKGVYNRKAILMLWVTAAIWGFAFVAQRAGMEFIGPFTFNGIRFLLGSISLLPLLLWMKYKQKGPSVKQKNILKGGLLAGLVLFIAASLQQAGMVYTTAGKAGFITGFYVVLVPLIGVFIGQHITKLLWMGAILALAGLYMLTINGPFELQKGDLLILLSALFWAIHVQLINKLVETHSALPLSAFQFAICGILSLATAFTIEIISLETIFQAIWPLLYGGLMSVGIAYTLQVVAQQHVHPAYASIILSFETVFAVIGGWLLLHEMLSLRSLVGCLLMLAGIVIVQVWGSKR